MVTLIVGGNRKERIEKAKALANLENLKGGPNALVLKEEMMGIDQARELRHFLSLRPSRKKQKTALILEAQNLTFQAQNALLKALEETKAHVILTAPHPSFLLPTVVSRSRIVQLQDTGIEVPKNIKEEFLSLLHKNRGERLKWSEENKKTLSEESQVLKILTFWLALLDELLPQHPRLMSATRIILKRRKLLLQTNANPRFVLETCLLSLPLLEKSSQKG